MIDDGKPDNRRILFVVGSLNFGGAEGQLAMLAQGLRMRGWTVAVFLLEKSGMLVEHLEQAGIVVHDGGYRSIRTRWHKWISVCLCEARLIGCIRRLRPDVVHGFLPMTSFMSAVAGRLALAPLVVTSKRSLGRHQDRDPRFKLLDRIANAFSHVVTANSRAVASDAAARDGYDVSRIVVVPNGLDFGGLDQAYLHRDETRRALGLGDEDIAIAMVANLIPYKGHGELIEAFAQIAPSSPRVRLFLIGRDDGIGQALAQRANQLGVSHRVCMMGERHDVPVLLSAMDLGVMASHEEGFSNALLEKLAVGLPVVATDVGGNPEALQDMPDCILVKPEDADDLARGLREAIGKVGANGHNRKVRQRLVRDRYSVDAMVDAYERLYLSPPIRKP